LAIWWQNVETSSLCYYQQQFQPTNIYELLFVNFIFSFLIGFGCGLTVIKYHHIAKPQTLCARPFGSQFFMQRMNYKKTQLLLSNIKINSVKEMTCLVFVHSDL
jgi:hypothetical protein